MWPCFSRLFSHLPAAVCSPWGRLFFFSFLNEAGWVSSVLPFLVCWKWFFHAKSFKNLSLTKVLKPSSAWLEYIPRYTLWNHSLSPALTTVVKYRARKFGESRNMCAFRLLFGTSVVKNSAASCHITCFYISNNCMIMMHEDDDLESRKTKQIDINLVHGFWKVAKPRF